MYEEKLEKMNKDKAEITNKDSKNKESREIPVNDESEMGMKEPFSKDDSENCGVVIENKCEKCDFIGRTDVGLRIHINAKHKINLKGYSRVVANNVVDFETKCDKCEYVASSKEDLKLHGYEKHKKSIYERIH